ncbi:MAG: hypothetical protein OES47_05865 [Acidobacteriota bacterium]|nr:hypothetical protein [Acidobacteriota bacterium]
MTESEPQQPKLALIIGVAALFGGLWLLLNAQGVGVPPFKKLWPVLFLLAGAASLADYLFLSRHPRAVGWVVAWTGFGVLGLALTYDYTNMRRILDWLPSFPTIIGLAVGTTWLAGGRKSSNLPIAAAVLVGLGLMGFAARFDVLKAILPSVQVIWAILFLGAGGYLVWRTVAQSRK